MKKLYICHPISTTGEFNDSIRVAKRIEGVGMNKFDSRGKGKSLTLRKFGVYAPALNDEINDKSNSPTPAMIYDQDVDNLLSSDIVIINYTGGDADGTVLELGMLAGMYEAGTTDLPSVLVYSSNKRALQPQLHHGIASGKLNHMVLGAIDKHFKWCGDEEGMIRELRSLGDEK